MRKWFILISLVSLTVLAYGAPWGAMADFDQPATPAHGKTYASGVKGERYLLPQLLAGETLRVYVSVPHGEEDSLDKYQKLIAQSYNKWFTDTARFIQKAKREQEFADILPLLQKGVSVSIVERPEQADISFQIMPFKEMQRQCGYGTSGCYIRIPKNETTPRIILPKDHTLLKLMSMGKLSSSAVGLHEIGHSLGLSDQYEKARNYNSHDRYASIRSGSGTMDTGGALTCDDADGLINLIDLVRGTARNGNTGWKTLCPKSNEFYVRGQSGLRGPYRVLDGDQGKFTLNTYQNGQEVSSVNYTLKDQGAFLPAVFVQGKVLERDALGRPVLSEGIRGEKIYYSYWFEEYLRLVVKGNSALLAEREYFSGKGRKKVKYRMALFKRNGKWAKATASYFPNKAGNIFYQEVSPEDEEVMSLTMDFDSKGKVVETYKKYNQPVAGVRNMAAPARAENPFGVKIQGALEQRVDNSRQEQLKEQLSVWFRGGR